jgi:hypothetical protein
MNSNPIQELSPAQTWPYLAGPSRRQIPPQWKNMAAFSGNLAGFWGREGGPWPGPPSERGSRERSSLPMTFRDLMPGFVRQASYRFLIFALVPPSPPSGRSPFFLQFHVAV